MRKLFKMAIAIPPGMLSEVDKVTALEHRTRTGLIQEALRNYIDSFNKRQNKVIALRLPECFDSTSEHKIKDQ